MTDREPSAKTARFDFVSEVSALLPFYVVCIFLSGWAYDDYYFRLFGLDPRVLDLGFHDTLVKGFIIIFSGATWLVAPYVALTIGVLLIGRLRCASWGKFLGMAALFSGCLLAVYMVSRSAGEEAARTDKGDRSTLPDITFAVAKQERIGKLVFIKGDSYLVHRVRRLGDDKGGELQLSVYKVSAIEDVQITEHQ